MAIILGMCILRKTFMAGSNKTEIAKEWEKLGKGKLHFFLVHNGNVDEILSKVKLL